ncbi:SUMO-specific isopeptidase USPL1-like isoform X1 [Carassius auratus]|uniref:SUMO-specific isopeptidase USPL1-like isoform X1 n=2 Tax=Carassius auratus TaxID=7957 RepID=A0A6P6KUV0_CARAU|nr:SUMO-specific isopeptidase USPL1-like isoform X1 [Carassius auratus]XP_026076091.1 SUMO-specific isopeptidase USPL1-like isoform X1 [Carassius auratus]
MSSLWPQDSSKNGNLGGMRMNGEGTGIGTPTPAVAGYLGKCEEKNGTPPGNCPWCLTKGQKNALRFYAVNLEESVMLCTNPPCLYPLVSRSLEDVRASLSKDGCKRSISFLSDVDDTSSPSKRLKEEKLDVLSAVPEPCGADVSDGTLPDNTVESQMFTDEQSILGKTDSINGTEEQHPEDLPAVATHEDLELCDKKDDCVSSTQDKVEEIVGMDVDEESSELVPVPPHLFWKNEDNLCWLDSLLAMLVNCKTIRETPCQNVKLIDELTTVPSSNSAVWNLCFTYDKSCANLKAKEQHCEDEVTRVPADVLCEVEKQLSALRLSLFKLLQPTLKCEIGQEETPVFALPLLLRADKWAQELFQHTVRWEFKCNSCSYTLNDSVEKTLTTFTQILNDWHPLKAIHRTQCSNCNRKNQRRKMVLEKLSSVFALHFVEGLPRKDLSKLSFEFQGTHYNVSTVIQYNKRLKHFATWIRQSSGSWLELDDLKYPYSITHKRFSFPANEIHIVFWESDSTKNEVSEVLSPTAPSALTNVEDRHPHELSDSVADDTCVISALTVGDSTAAGALDTSIGSTTLLDTFEGLSHTDIVTLTLVDENRATEALQIPQSPALIPATIPSLSVASSSSCISKSVCQPSNPPKPQSSGLKEGSLVSNPVVPRPSVATQVHSPSPFASSLLQRHPSFQSTPITLPPHVPKPNLKCDNEALPAKPADMFGGFISKKLPNSSDVNPAVAAQHKPITLPGGTCPSVKKNPSLLADQQPITSTEALRLKLLKKLKAKKKKLAKLNQLLGSAGESTPKPDSTALSSPYSVTSSTTAYDSPAYDQFFAELLSPATTVSNLSPDSTGLLEMLNNGQNVEKTVGSAQQNPCVTTMVPEATLNYSQSTNDSVLNLDDYISGMDQTAIENTDFNGLDIFF